MGKLGDVRAGLLKGLIPSYSFSEEMSSPFYIILKSAKMKYKG